MRSSISLFLLALTSLTTAQSCATIIKHEVLANETLTRIGNDNGVSVSQLLAANPSITNPDNIDIGQIVNVPAPTCVPGSETAKCPGVTTYKVADRDTL